MLTPIIKKGLLVVINSGFYRWALLLVIMLLSACDDSNNSGSDDTTVSPADISVAAAVPQPPPMTSFLSADLSKSGEKQDASACAECHLREVKAWQQSHHALANRVVSMEQDGAIFKAAQPLTLGAQQYQPVVENDQFIFRELSGEGVDKDYPVVAVIGHTPIKQYLVAMPGNRFQAFSGVYELDKKRWLDVFGGEQRQPGEWGHWTGQGMNWNANCAYCHTTDFKKQLDFQNNSYSSSWAQLGVGCGSCHGQLKEHLESARQRLRAPVTPPAMTIGPLQMQDACASCHSRRDQITADGFRPGDRYNDHFQLLLPDTPGLYYADGQIRDEVFVYGSFAGSRMHHAGVTCLNCHNPHSLETLLPVENNQLCLQCHQSGTLGAPVIDAPAHSFHAEGSSGNQCVSCHMPKTTYMQVDPRADHGFLKPDPLMTKELGIPNACSGCHQDQSLDWSIQWTQQWYGDKLADSRQRLRAQALDAASRYEPQAMEKLIALNDVEDIPAWRATYIGLLANYLPAPQAQAVLQKALKDSSALVRARAAEALARHGNVATMVMDAFGDDSRLVRLSAARGMAASGQPIPVKASEDELVAYLDFHRDRPQALLLLASRASAQEHQQIAQYIQRAIILDPSSPEIYHQGAIILSSAGLGAEAAEVLQRGLKQFPTMAVFPYSLALLAGENQQLSLAIHYLEQAVALEPGFTRAWYNLALAYAKTGQREKAQAAMARARE